MQQHRNLFGYLTEFLISFLAARCGAFQPDQNDDSEPLKLPLLSARAFKVFLEFLYTDVLRHLDDDSDVFALARMYQVRALMQYRSEVMKGRGQQALGKHSLAGDLQRLHESETAADVVLRVEDRSFRAHKALLAARSIFFSSLFCGNWKVRLYASYLYICL